MRRKGVGECASKLYRKWDSSMRCACLGMSCRVAAGGVGGVQQAVLLDLERHSDVI